MKINLVKNEVVITKKENAAMSNPKSDEFAELMSLRSQFPNLKVVVRETKSRDCYKGLTEKFMAQYIEKNGDEEVKEEFNSLMGKDSILADKVSYGELKMWFLSKFPEIEEFYTKRNDVLKTAKATMDTRRKNRAAA
ncbi:MAG: hypothetical protein IJB73_04055 [Firmicutes bacterium]|nr:hypothetical protein [Bacillota bacterium]